MLTYVWNHSVDFYNNMMVSMRQLNNLRSNCRISHNAGQKKRPIREEIGRSNARERIV